MGAPRSHVEFPGHPDRCVGEAGGVGSGHIMPVASEAIAAAKGALRAESVDRRGLFLKRAALHGGEGLRRQFRVTEV